ncbi:phospholipase A and acyltransferase 3-like [Branchiostoma floridae x Branchiostoma belcheri]
MSFSSLFSASMSRSSGSSSMSRYSGSSSGSSSMSHSSGSSSMSCSSGSSASKHLNQDVLSRCKEGDILEFPREGGYNHLAVYVGNERVIHRTADAGVREDSFWDVVGDSIARINNYLDGEKSVFPGEEIVARARSQLGTGGYDLVSKNCEHFVTWCRYGVERSQQVSDVDKHPY